MFLTEDTPLSSFRDGCGAKKLIFEMNDIGVIHRTWTWTLMALIF
jgi:hypothetical protein